MARGRTPHDPSGVAVAAAVIVLGLVVIRQAGSLTPMGSVFPITIASTMIAVSALLIARNVLRGLRRDAPAAAQADAPARGAAWRMAAFFVAMVVWVAALPVIGFFVSSLVGFFLVMATALHTRVTTREGVALVVTGLVVVGSFYVVMSQVLLIPVPRGLLF